MKQKTKNRMFGLFGYGCKAAFHMMAFIIVYKHSKLCFSIMMSIMIVHNIVTYLFTRDKKIEVAITKKAKS